MDWLESVFTSYRCWKTIWVLWSLPVSMGEEGDEDDDGPPSNLGEYTWPLWGVFLVTMGVELGRMVGYCAEGW